MEGNSIMEQGQIDALLAANPADRRGIFEEAAGVSRYKQRRKEADQRLKRTRENLDRLRDVLDLEEKRYRSLKTQAAARGLLVFLEREACRWAGGSAPSSSGSCSDARGPRRCGTD